jgi:excisionase family DNA binding protein
MAYAPDVEYYTIAEAAQRLRVSRTTVWRWVRNGTLPAVRFGPRTIRIRAEDLGRSVTEDEERAARIEALWRDYDPERVRAALRATAGILAGVDIKRLKADLRAERRQASSGRPAD